VVPVPARPRLADAGGPGPGPAEVGELAVLGPGRPGPGTDVVRVVGLRAGDPGEALDEVGVVLLERCSEPGTQGLEVGRGRPGIGQLPQLLEDLGPLGPDGRVVEHAEGDADQLVVGDQDRLAGLRVGELDGLAEQPPGQPVEAPLGVAFGEGAVGAAGVAQPEELLQGLVGALGAAQPGRERQGAGLVAAAGGPGHRVEDAVHDQGPDLAREQVGVGRTQVGAVGVAGVGQRGVADRPPQQVHVAGHVGRRHVVQDRPAPLGAGPGHGPVGADPDPLLLPGHWEREGRQEVGQGVLERLIAPQRGAAHDAAGVEADQVEAGPDLVGEEEGAALEDHVDPGAARPAGVDEQRADPAAGVAGREPGQGQGDLPALGLVVVERDHGGGALEGLQALAFGRAAAPVQLGHGRRAGAQGGRGGGGGRRDGEQGGGQGGDQGREHGPAEPAPRVRGMCQDKTPLRHAPAARKAPAIERIPLRAEHRENRANWGLTESGRSGRVRDDGTVAFRMSPCC
jgi:hypothetical protein